MFDLNLTAVHYCTNRRIKQIFASRKHFQSQKRNLVAFFFLLEPKNYSESMHSLNFYQSFASAKSDFKNAEAGVGFPPPPLPQARDSGSRQISTGLQSIRWILTILIKGDIQVGRKNTDPCHGKLILKSGWREISHEKLDLCVNRHVCLLA